MNKCASIAVVVALIGGLSACEYSPDSRAINDPGQSPSSVPASGESNTAALMRVLGPPDATGLPYETGPDATLNGEIGPGQFLLTAGCVGASGADVSVTFGDSSPENYSFSCGMGKVIQIDHAGGKILAEVGQGTADRRRHGLET